MRRAVASVVLVAAAVAGVVQLAAVTMNRPDPVREGSATTVVFETRARRWVQTERAGAEGLWGVCAVTTGSRTLPPGLVAAGGGRYQVTVTPALGRHAVKRLTGCIEDAKVERLQGRVVALQQR